MNPFAPPDRRRTPERTWWTPIRMGSAFRVDGHLVEVETHHLSGDERYRVDGVDVVKRRYLGWHSAVDLAVGGRTVGVRSRWYPLLPVVVEVDGRVVIDDLFPQQAIVQWTLFAPAAAAALLFTGSIARDLLGMALLLAASR